MGAVFPFWLSPELAKLAGHSITEWVSFSIFWAINILIIYKGMNLLKKVEGLAAPFVVLMTFLLLVWSIYQANGVGYLMKDTGKFKTVSEFMPVFIPSLTAMIGFWATLSLNMPDFTRFGRSQKEQTRGQVLSLPTSMTVFSAMGILITSAALTIFPGVSANEIWDPVKLIGHFEQPVVVAIAMFTIGVATLSVNIAANVVSPANDFANAFPRWISFRTGALITGVCGILMQPWKLVADPSGFIFEWLLGYSGGLGSIAGVLIADYWLVRKRDLNLSHLYLEDGEYSYHRGWNWRAVVATVVGCAAAWVGLVVPELKVLFDYGWFLGFAVASGLYVLLAGVGRSRS